MEDLSKIKNWVENKLNNIEKDKFYTCHYSYKKKFNFSQEFYGKILDLNPNEERFVGEPIVTEKINEFGEKESYTYYKTKTTVFIDELNKLLDCYFFEVKSSLDALSHVFNILFKLSSDEDKIYFQYLYDAKKHYRDEINVTENMRTLAPETFKEIEKFKRSLKLVDDFRNKITHESIVTKLLMLKARFFPGESYEKEEIVYPFKFIFDNKQYELPKTIENINIALKEFYSNIYKNIIKDLK